MRKLLRPVLALVAMVSVGTYAYAGLNDGSTNVTPNPDGSGGTIVYDTTPWEKYTDRAFSGFGNTGYGALLSFDSFRYSIRKRMETMRIGTQGQPFGSPFRSVGSGYSGGRDYDTYNRGGGYYNQNYNQQSWNPPAGTYNQNWNPPPVPAPQPSYNAPSSYDPYGGGGNFNPNYNQQQNQWGQPYSYNGSFASDSAYAMAPSSRSGTYSSASRRMLDCVYYSGFSVWADIYQTWAKQRSRSLDEGYRYRTTGPAIGVDWTNGPVTVGMAMTYNWGKMNARDIDHDMKIRTWALDIYAQYNAQNWYVNGNLGYAHNRYKSDRYMPVYHNAGTVANPDMEYGVAYNHASFKSNAWNFDLEYGWKLDWKGVQVVPNVGIRYFHDRRGSINENGIHYAVHADGKNYHTFEVPIGVNFAYEIASAGRVFVPRARLAWIPELSRKSGSWSGYYTRLDENGDLQYVTADETSAKRSRHGFLIGVGLEARLSKSLSAHIDYNCNFRSKQYEHHWNLGAAFTF